MNKNWTTTDIPSLVGKTVVVTGGNNGIGYHTALELARAGAHVIIGSRDLNRGMQALEKMNMQAPGLQLSVKKLDLADLETVHEFAGQIQSELSGLDILINNAGVMAVPKRELTKQGFEMHFGTNHLGHFALTGLLLPLLKKSKGRVVTVSAKSSHAGRIDFNDLTSEKNYSPMGNYNRSKLSNVMFAIELQHRVEQAGVTSVVVHPGTSVTGLQQHVPKWLQKPMEVLINRFLGQSTDKSALPSLLAATTPSVAGGAFFGPTGRFEMKGPPGVVPLPKSVKEEQIVKKLWEVSEKLTGVKYGIR